MKTPKAPKTPASLPATPGPCTLGLDLNLGDRRHRPTRPGGHGKDGTPADAVPTHIL